MRTNSLLNFHPIIIVVLLFSLIRCAPLKIDPPEVKVIDVIVENSTSDKPVIIDNAISNEDYTPDLAKEQELFDWENLAYLPLPDYYAKAHIPMPWSDKANRHFSDDIRYDIKKTDGWELYLSDFSPQFITGLPSFSLYNKYKGILRYYFFMDFSIKNVQDYNILLNNMHLVGPRAAESPLLNFANQNIIDISKNSLLCTTLEPQPLTDSTWYAVEYDLAYDKNIYTQNASSIMFACNFSMLQTPSFSLNGKAFNKLNAKIRFSDVQLGTISSYSGDVSLLLYGKNDLYQLAEVLSASDLTELNQIMNQHSYSNMLYGTMDGNALGDMKWNANLNFTFSPIGVGLLSDSFVISGADNSFVQGICPFYTKPLGVFYLDKKPVYTYTKLSDSSHSHQYALNVSSVQYIFNPSVTEIADIKNIEQVLVATENKSLFRDNSNVKLFTGQKLTSNLPVTIQGVRVSFDVVPKDGGKTVHIVKTFQANLENK